MKRIAWAVCLLIGLLATGPAAQNPLVVDVWPGKSANDAGIAGAEKFFELTIKGKPYIAPCAEKPPAPAHQNNPRMGPPCSISRRGRCK